MLTIAFWNIRRRVGPDTISAFAREVDADVLVLAENHIAIGELLPALSAQRQQEYFRDVVDTPRLVILTRFPPTSRDLIRDSHGFSIREYELPLLGRLLLVAVHLPSKLWEIPDGQTFDCMRLARAIDEAEANVEHSRTLVIGDFNANPFEPGIVGFGGLHAVMDRRIAQQESRIFKKELGRYFYNPMWSVFGDLKLSPPGTYFYNTGSQVNYFWNVFDQVLLRPALLRYFREDHLSVVTQIDGKSLLNKNGRPKKAVYSDHLPIVLRLSEG